MSRENCGSEDEDMHSIFLQEPGRGSATRVRLEDGQKFARQREGRPFHARETAYAKAKQIKAFRNLCRM